MLIFTKDRYGNPGHPTKRFDMLRKLRKLGQIRFIGGSVSGKPPVAVFMNKKFTSSKTVNRQFVRVIDPGYHNIGYAVCEVIDSKIIVFCKGHLETRIADIRKLMQERRAYRRQRRYISRYKMRRLSHRQGKVLTKFKAPRNIRSVNQNNATLQHGVTVHLNLYGKMRKFCPLPDNQTHQVMESNVFDIRTMTWGQTNGKGYQQSPRTVEKEYKCIVCGAVKNLHKHHLIHKKNNGTNIKENLIYLCKDCHEDVHAERVYLPIKGINQWRALGTMNAIAGVLRGVKNIHFVSASDMAVKRRELGIGKGHADDAVATAAVFAGYSTVIDTDNYLSLKKFRRHNRARIHALRDRLYKIDGKIIAKNRRKRMGQEFDSLADLPYEARRNLVVYPGLRVLSPFRKNMPAVGGDMWLHTPSGKRFIATGVSSGKYLFSPILKDIVGKPYISPVQCKRLLRNEGVVIWKD